MRKYKSLRNCGNLVLRNVTSKFLMLVPTSDGIILRKIYNSVFSFFLFKKKCHQPYSTYSHCSAELRNVLRDDIDIAGQVSYFLEEQ